MSCRDCGAEWAGTGPCHCTGCHETFSSESSFTMHQRIDKEGHGTCLDPEEMLTKAGERRLIRNKRGHWGAPPPDKSVWGKKD